MNRHDLAIELFQQAIRIDNSSALFYYNLGISFYSLGRREKAVRALKTALEKEVLRMTKRVDELELQIGEDDERLN